MSALAVRAAPTELATLRDTVNLAETAMCLVGNSILPVISAVGALADFDATDVRALQQRLREIHALAHVGRRLAEDAHNQLDCEREDFAAKLAAIQGAAK